MNIYTIGFTAKSAREFFEALRTVEAKYLVDIRVHNNSQLAGFTKKGNIEYFTERLTSLAYVHLPVLAPSVEMFKQYRQNSDWPGYEAKYLDLLRERDVGLSIDKQLIREGAVLLCSEPTPEKCHRRLAAEFLRDHLFEDARIIHL